MGESAALGRRRGSAHADHRRHRAGAEEVDMRRLWGIIRGILLLAIVALVILSGVLAFNVVTHGARQIQLAAMPRTPVDAQPAAARLAEAIRFKTVSSYE